MTVSQASGLLRSRIFARRWSQSLRTQQCSLDCSHPPAFLPPANGDLGRIDRKHPTAMEAASARTLDFHRDIELAAD
jgi:hypothetical protein